MPLTGRDRPVVSFEASAAVGCSGNESVYLRNDFLGAYYLVEFSEQCETPTSTMNSER
jgi:hypothetical protein